MALGWLGGVSVHTSVHPCIRRQEQQFARTAERRTDRSCIFIAHLPAPALPRTPQPHTPHALTTPNTTHTYHPTPPRLTPQVRLEHMLQRLRVLQRASSTARPTRLLPRLYLSGAVEANSHHLLRHLGVSHILNATEVGGSWLGG